MMNKHEYDESVAIFQYIQELSDSKYQYDHSQYSDELEKWALRLNENALAAMHYLNKYPFKFYNENNRKAAMDFYGADDPNHPFKRAAKPWVWLQEQQITTSFAILFNQCNDATKKAILRALMPDKKWPDNLTKIAAESEVHTKKGRIDILIHAVENKKPVAIVIEAKFGHHVKGNPLNDYRKYAKIRFPEADRKHLILAIKAPEKRKGIKGKWEFIAWADFMRRIEIGIVKLRNDGEYFHPQDQDFIMLRRLIWEKI